VPVAVAVMGKTPVLAAPVEAAEVKSRIRQ